MKVPFFNNHLQYKGLKEQWKSRVEKVWESGQYFNGCEVQELEKRLASICQRKYAVALASCSDALTISAQFYSIPRWAVSSFTFIASASSMVRAHSKVHFTSLNKSSFSPQAFEYSESIKSQTDIGGIVHVDLYGSCQSSGEVERFCQKNNLVMIEDAAQSFGGYCENRPAGSFGDASCLSFDPTKIIAGTSAAGALLTDNYELSEYAKSLRVHGRSNDTTFSRIGMKSLMSSSEAAIINLKLDHLEKWVKNRNAVADLYRKILQHERISLPRKKSNHKHSFHKYVIKVPSSIRKSLRQHLINNGIETRVHYPQCLSNEKAFQDNFTTKDRPLRLYNCCEEVLSLPIYPEMSNQQIEHVGHSILGFFNASKR